MKKKEIFKKLKKMSNKGHICSDFGSDGIIKTKRKGLEINFIEIPTTSKLYKKGCTFLNKFFSKKLKAQRFLVQYDLQFYTCYIERG